jgi:multiple sugar transport system permease protein
MLKHRRVQLRKDIYGWLLVAPLLIWAAFFVVSPLLSTIRMSFYDQRSLFKPGPFVGLSLYVKMLKSSSVWHALERSLHWTFSNLILMNVLALGTALLLFQEFRGRDLLRTWMLVPWVLPTVVLAVIFRFMLNSSLGVVTYIAKDVLHLTDKPVLFLASVSSAMPTLAAINSWKWFPFRALMFLASLLNISQDLFDAAKVDGANIWHRFRYLMWPELLPVVAITSLLGGFQLFNDLAIVYVFTGGGPGEATLTLPMLLYEKAYRTWRPSEAAVLTVLMGVVLIIFTLVYFRVRPGEEREA